MRCRTLQPVAIGRDRWQAGCSVQCCSSAKLLQNPNRWLGQHGSEKAALAWLGLLGVGLHVDVGGWLRAAIRMLEGAQISPSLFKLQGRVD